jgi:hypothetical protein
MPYIYLNTQQDNVAEFMNTAMMKTIADKFGTPED